MDALRIPAYLTSLPERLVRSVAALSAGTVQEAGEVLLPARVRRSRLYGALVETTLRFLVEQVGEVTGANRDNEPLPSDAMPRLIAGNLVGIASVATIHASPVWVFAALADIAGAGRELIGEIGEELRAEGLLEPGGPLESVEQLLDALEGGAARLTSAANLPPLNVASLREEWRLLRAEAGKLPRAVWPTPERLAASWCELCTAADAQGRPVAEVSALLALSAVRRLPAGVSWLPRAARAAGRRTGDAVARGLLDHYCLTLLEIHQTGYARYWVRELSPYWTGALQQFSPSRLSLTERLLGRGPAGRAIMSPMMDVDLRYPIGPYVPSPPPVGAGREQLIADLEQAPAGLREAVAGLDDAQLDTPYREGGWTLRQVVHHLADAQMNWSVRTRLALTEVRPLVVPYAEALWAELDDARTGPLEPSLRLLEGVNARWAALLRSLREEEWTREMRHPESGVLAVGTSLAMMVWHCRHHTAQITTLRARLGW